MNGKSFAAPYPFSVHLFLGMTIYILYGGVYDAKEME